MSRAAAAHAPPAELEALLADCWRRLEDGVDDPASPLHTPALGSVDGDGCQLRIVVLRRVDAALRRIVCHTDTRSPKAAQLRLRPRTAWLFYDAAARVQIRAEGPASLHVDDTLAEQQWQASRPLSRRCYLGAAPGEPSPVPTSGLPEELLGRAPEIGESEAGRARFTVLACSADRLDRLDLAAHGHQRAQWRWDGGAWRGRWVAP